MYQIRGKCCPIFLHPELLGSFDVSTFFQGKMLSNLSPRAFWGDSIVPIRGKGCPIFRHEMLGVNQCIILVFGTGGKAAQFFPVKIVGWFHFSNQREMLPNLMAKFWGAHESFQIWGSRGGTAVHSFRAKLCPFLGAKTLIQLVGNSVHFYGTMLSIFGGSWAVPNLHSPFSILHFVAFACLEVTRLGLKKGWKCIFSTFQPRWQMSMKCLVL